MEKPIIIVEGIDRVGKTTLCEKLSKAFDLEIYNRPSDGFDFSKLKCGDVYREEYKLLQDIEDKREKPYIFDRFNMSEYIFGAYFRHYDMITNRREYYIIDSKLTELKAILILVVPTDIARSNAEQGYDQSHLNTSFLTMFTNSSIRRKYIVSYDAFDKIIEQIKGDWENAQ